MIGLLELTLLGHLRISYNGALVTGFVSNKAQALLGYLAITGQPHPRDDLAALLWSDMPEAEAKANLRVVLCNLRQLFPDYVQVNRKTVAFQPQGPCWIDATAFQASVQQYAPAKGETITALRAAVELYQGDLMHGLQPRGALLFEEWLLLQREHLRQQVMQSCYTLAAHHLLRAEYAEALRHTMRLIKMEPWHEEAHRQAMLLFALSGQRSVALAQFKLCQQLLSQELGIEPEEETVALDQRIRAGTVSDGVAARSGPEAALRLPPLSFVGRGDAFAWLMGQYEAARAGAGALTLIEGTEGVGKTYLAEEMLRFVASTGALLLRTRCHAFSQTVAYQPVSDLLRAVFTHTPEAFAALPDYWLIKLRQLLPELYALKPNLVAPPLLSEPLERQHLFEAVAVLLNELEQRHGEVVVFVDDLHHADPATVDLLNYLTHRCHGAAIWYLGAYQAELLAPNHPLLKLCAELRRTHQVATLGLGNLSLPAIRHLVEGLVGLEPATLTLLSTELHTVSGGNPLLLRCILEDLVEREILCLVRDDWWLHTRRFMSEAEQVPPVIQALISARVERLPPEAQALLPLAALIGRSFALDLLAKAVGRDVPEVVRWVAPLLTCQLVQEVVAPAQPEPPLREHAGALRYEFVNPLIWRAVGNRLSEGERRRLVEQLTVASRGSATTMHSATSVRRPHQARPVTCSRSTKPWGSAVAPRETGADPVVALDLLGART